MLIPELFRLFSLCEPCCSDCICQFCLKFFKSLYPRIFYCQISVIVFVGFPAPVVVFPKDVTIGNIFKSSDFSDLPERSQFPEQFKRALLYVRNTVYICIFRMNGKDLLFTLLPCDLYVGTLNEKTKQLILQALNYFESVFRDRQVWRSVSSSRRGRVERLSVVGNAVNCCTADIVTCSARSRIQRRFFRVLTHTDSVTVSKNFRYFICACT